MTSVHTDSVQDDFTSTSGPDAAAQDKQKAGSCKRLSAAAHSSGPGACNRRQPLPRHLQIFRRSILPVGCGAFYDSSFQEDAAATTGPWVAAAAEDRKAGCLGHLLPAPLIPVICLDDADVEDLKAARVLVYNAHRKKLWLDRWPQQHRLKRRRDNVAVILTGEVREGKQDVILDAA